MDVVCYRNDCRFNLKQFYILKKQEADEGEDPETVAVITAERATLEQAVRDIAQSVIADADMSAAFADSPRNAAVDKLMQSMADWGGACFSPRYFLLYYHHG